MGNLPSASIDRPTSSPLAIAIRLFDHFSASYAVDNNNPHATANTNPYANKAKAKNPYATAKSNTGDGEANNGAGSGDGEANNGAGNGEFDGRASSTQSGHKDVVKKWDMFAAAHKHPLFHELTQQFVCGKVYDNGSMSNQNNPPIRAIMSQFAKFLVDYVKQEGEVEEDEEAHPLEEEGEEEDGEGELPTGRETYKGLAPGTIMLRFTQLKARLFAAFPPLGYLGDTPDWYLGLLRSLKQRVNADCVARGGTISKKAVGIGRTVLSSMCDYLMKQKDQELGYEERCVLAVLFAAVGRGGEVALTAWNSARWDPDREHLLFDWSELKKSAQYGMTFHPDATDWRLDVLHALACYLICRHGSLKASSSQDESDGTVWLFPAFVDMANGGAANKTSRIIEKCRNGGVEGIPDDSRSHAFRVGATDEMVHHYMLSVFCAIARGGWDFKSDNLAFYYFTKSHRIAQGGKALANWHDPNMHVSAPSLAAFINDDNRDRVEGFCEELFRSANVPGLNSTLKDVRNAMVASLLRYYDDVVDQLGSESLVVKTIRNAALRRNIGLHEITEWGRKVKQLFLVKNAQNLGEVGASEAERLKKTLAVVQQGFGELLEQQKQADARLARIEKNQDNLMSMMDTLLLRLAPDSPSPVRNNKRKAPSSPTESAAEKSPPGPPVASSNPTGYAALMVTKPKGVWDGATGWLCAKLVLQVLDDRVDFMSQFFLADATPKKRLACRTVLKELKELSGEDDKKFFDWKKLPVGDSPYRTAFIEELNTSINALAMKLSRKWIKLQLETSGKYSAATFKSRVEKQTMKVSALAKLIEKTNTQVNKMKKAP